MTVRFHHGDVDELPLMMMYNNYMKRLPRGRRGGAVSTIVDEHTF